MSDIVVIAEELSPATVDALGPDVEVRHSDGTDRVRLLADMAEAAALLIRSATRVDAELLRAAPKLKVVARAGVGLDNVDIKAATDAGVMVVNAPTSNIVSAAELTVGHILSLARNIPQAHASLSAGRWERSTFTGTELQGKQVGIIGLGRIGSLIAERLQAFDMEIVAHDPYVTSARAAQLGVRLATLDELLETSDFISIHMPKTPETTGMVNADSFARMKDTAYITNVARGGLIDEDDLCVALAEGRIAGASLDVFTAEPPASDHPLLALENVVLTPHLGASTHEAQEKAGISVARSVRLALAGELVPDAVNVAGGAIDPLVRPGLPLTEKLGQILTALSRSPLTRLEVVVAGEIAEKPHDVLRLAALKGLFHQVSSEQVSYVNAPVLAGQRGLDVALTTAEAPDSYRNTVTLKGALSDGSQLSVTGTLTGPRQVEKLVGINDFEVEMPISDHLVVLSYPDRPGVVGVLGRVLGEEGVNIGAMQISRTAEGGKALALLTLDDTVAPALLAKVAEEVAGATVRLVDLDLE